MNFFDKYFPGKGNDDKPEVFDWKELSGISQLDDLVKRSMDQPVWVFKNSTKCGISSMVLKKLEKKLSDLSESPDFYMLDLIRYRDLSNEIAQRFGVLHQSPQLIKIQNGKAVSNASHYGILEMKL